ncbi:hypothetical protein LCGC14_3057950, partial [marine sediment metagenome]
FGVGWAAGVTIYNGNTWEHPVLAYSSQGFYAFWLPKTANPTAGHVFYRKSTDGGSTWTDEAGANANEDWIDESVDGFSTCPESIALYMHAGGESSYIGLGYSTTPGTPYDVRHVILDADPSDSAEVYGHVIIRNIGSAELYASFTVNQWYAELYGHAEIRQETSVELYAHVEIQDTEDLYAHTIIRNISSAEAYGHAEIRQETSADLYAHVEIQDTAELYAHAVIRQPASAELYSTFIVKNIDSAELYASFEVQQLDSVELYSHTIIRHSDTAELYSHFRVRCSRIFGENWQRKMWFDGTYYWRSRYCPTDDRLEFDYISKDGLEGNVWTENANARINAAGFDAAAILADFSV